MPVAKKAYRFLRRWLGSALIDRPARIETARIVSMEELGLAGPARVRYEPSGWLDLRRAMRPGEVRGADVFLDLGSGKGRVVLAAARFRFRRVIGNELSEELSAVA